MENQPIQILLVEDNEDDLLMMFESFEEVPFINVVGFVCDGEEAMAYLRRQGKFKNVSLPGLILLDINMPKKNGFEVLQEMKADPMLQHIPVVMLTTSDRKEDIINAYAYGACSYIPKPVGFDRFVAVVKQFSLYWTLVSRIPGRNQ